MTDQDTDRTKRTLKIEVEYDLNGTPPKDVEDLLHNLAQRAVGEGLLTGHTDAEVEEWSCKVIPTPPADAFDKMLAALRRLEQLAAPHFTGPEGQCPGLTAGEQAILAAREAITEADGRNIKSGSGIGGIETGRAGKTLDVEVAKPMVSPIPGPWHVQTSDSEPGRLLIKPVPGQVIAITDPAESEEQEMANAILLAAAPDMMNVALSAKAYLEHESAQGTGISFEGKEVLRSINAVLAKMPGQMVAATGHAESEEQEMAHSALLSAAPVLLEAAQESLEYLRNQGWHGNGTTTELGLMLETAINKAHGDRPPESAAASPEADEDGRKLYGYYVNLDERGDFYADVRDVDGNTVFEVRAGNELGEDETSLVEDGHMRHNRDLEGLATYLSNMGYIPNGAALLPSGRFEKLLEEKEDKEEDPDDGGRPGF